MRASLIATMMLLVSGCGASRVPPDVETSLCSERLQSELKVNETVELKLIDDTRVRGSFRAFIGDSLVLDGGEIPAQSRSFSLEQVGAVSYSRPGFQPSYMVAGLFCGVVVGGLYYALSDDDSPPCSEISCSADGLDEMATGGLIGLCIGTLLAGALPEKHEIVCHPSSSSSQ